MIPICSRQGDWIVCIDAHNTTLRLGGRYEVDHIVAGFDYAFGRNGYGVVLKGVPSPAGMIAYNRARFAPAPLPDALTRLLAPKPYGERPDTA